MYIGDKLLEPNIISLNRERKTEVAKRKQIISAPININKWQKLYTEAGMVVWFGK